MKVYNQSKTEILDSYDIEKGRLVEDTLETLIAEIPYIAEEGHYETIAEYPNGGKDVKWVVDKAGQEYQPERVEYEQIIVFVPYTDEELLSIKVEKELQKKEETISELKNKLVAFSEDIIQDLAGEEIPDIEVRKNMFVEIHNQIRVLLGKEPRRRKPIQESIDLDDVKEEDGSEGEIIDESI